MENINQRIIFDVPGEITLAEIISTILTKNGVAKDTVEELFNENKRPKIAVVSGATKELFDKKITEDKMSELFQTEFKISKEISLAIIKELKEEIIPLAKKVTIPSDEAKKNVPSFFDTDETKKELPVDIEKNITERPAVVEQGLENNIANTTKKVQRIKKVPTVINPVPPPTQQSSGPDAYREPIE